MPQKLTDINGLTLQSELADKEIYSKIRTLQFLFLYTYSLGGSLKINEIKLASGYHYIIQNQDAGLIGFVGRHSKTQKITYVVKDKSRYKWAELEGFELTEENFNKIGIMAQCKDIRDFILFLAGKPGYDFVGYIRS